MTDEEIDLKNGETAWSVIKTMAKGDDAINKAELMVKQLGAEGAYKICKIDDKGFSDNLKETVMLAFKYLEHRHKQNLAAQ